MSVIFDIDEMMREKLFRKFGILPGEVPREYSNNVNFLVEWRRFGDGENGGRCVVDKYRLQVVILVPTEKVVLFVVFGVDELGLPRLTCHGSAFLRGSDGSDSGVDAVGESIGENTVEAIGVATREPSGDSVGEKFGKSEIAEIADKRSSDDC